MSRTKQIDLRKHTVRLRDGDVERLQDFYASYGVGANFIIRKLVSHHVDTMRRRLETGEPLPKVDIDL